MNWIEVPAGRYKILSEGKRSHCQLEISVRYVDMTSDLFPLLDTPQIR
jgi:hypothetical protein